MDAPTQISYWKNSAQEDLLVARELLSSGRRRHSLFFAHLALEKMLKAHYTLRKQSAPPKVHNLVQLARLAEVPVTATQLDFLREFSVHNIAGRYPDEAPISFPEEEVREDFRRCEEMFEWLQKSLS